MKPQKIFIGSGKNSPFLAGLTAAVVTTAAFAKSFVPFYLIGSTAIFAVSCLFGIVLVAASWRQIRDNATYATDFLVVIGLLYAVVVASYLFNSISRVPITHLLGILAFHGIFIAFGFAAARGLKTVFAVLIAQAVIYLIVIAQYTLRFGDLMHDGFLQDVFGVGARDPSLVTALHQQIGAALGLAVLAAFGFGSRRIKFVTFAVLPFVLLFMFHIVSRTAILALAGSLAFLMFASVWVRSSKLALLGLSSLLVAAVLASGLFYRYALQDKGVDKIASEAVSRTIREIQDPDPFFRQQIWIRAWHRIATEPRQLLVLGRGIGVYPIDEGMGAPDWLLHKTEAAKYTPHSVYLEMLYEAGILGMLLFGILTISPLVVSLKRWNKLSAPEKAAISLYVFYLVSVEISGSFAFSYDFQFFLALAIGVVSLKRKELAGARAASFEYLDHKVSA